MCHSMKRKNGSFRDARQHMIVGVTSIVAYTVLIVVENIRRLMDRPLPSKSAANRIVDEFPCEFMRQGLKEGYPCSMPCFPVDRGLLRCMFKWGTAHDDQAWSSSLRLINLKLEPCVDLIIMRDMLGSHRRTHSFERS